LHIPELDTIKGGMKVTLLHIGLAAFLVTPSSAFAMQDADDAPLDALDTGLPKPPVIKQEPAGAAELRDAVRRIAQRPTDSFALTDAGYAAIKLGDYDAAFNFFTKASAIQPADARIKSGLGIAQVRRENPFEALSLFDEAMQLGASERSFAMDRGLAFDLLGNFERAERDYVLAASFGESDELTMRHAISLSLAGRKDEADRKLIPMLQKENPEAWRARALMLAARGDAKEAGKIAAGFLPEREARRMDGYFRNMTRLTVAQQAAAMHFGHFPIGSDIGEDSDSVRTLATATGAKPAATGGDSRLIPSGEPLGTKTAAVKAQKPPKAAGKDKKPKPANAEFATASAQQAVDAASRAKVTTVAASQLPPPEAARPPVRIALPALARPKIATTELPTTELPATGPAVQSKIPDQPAATREPVVIATEKANAPAVEPAVVPPPVKIDTPIVFDTKIAEKGPIGPGFESVGQPKVIPEIQKPEIVTTELPPQTSPVVDQPAPVQNDPAPVVEQPAPVVNEPAPVIDQPKPVMDEPKPVEAAPEKSFDLGALVESIEVPEDEKRPSVAPVDLTKIKAAPPKTETAAAKTDAGTKAGKQPVSGPRIFVQIATGADATGLGYDYRRAAKKNAALFSGREGWTASWGKTRRLLVGPFPDMKSAKKWETDFRKAGGDGFVWQSDKNAEVEKLKGK
jgi:Flp pilus assembly protein TadD